MEASFAKYADEKRDELVTIVVGGAGFTGIEYVGELANRVPELANSTMYHVKSTYYLCRSCSNSTSRFRSSISRIRCETT